MCCLEFVVLRPRSASRIELQVLSKLTVSYIMTNSPILTFAVPKKSMHLSLLIFCLPKIQIFRKSCSSTFSTFKWRTNSDRAMNGRPILQERDLQVFKHEKASLAAKYIYHVPAKSIFKRWRLLSAKFLCRSTKTYRHNRQLLRRSSELTAS